MRRENGKKKDLRESKTRKSYEEKEEVRRWRRVRGENGLKFKLKIKIKIKIKLKFDSRARPI